MLQGGSQDLLQSGWLNQTLVYLSLHNEIMGIFVNALPRIIAKAKPLFGFMQVKYISFLNPVWVILCICPGVYF